MRNGKYSMLISDFLEYKYVNNKSKRTLNTYACQLELFFTWLKYESVISRVSIYAKVKDEKKREAINKINFCNIGI